MIAYSISPSLELPVSKGLSFTPLCVPGTLHRALLTKGWAAKQGSRLATTNSGAHVHSLQCGWEVTAQPGTRFLAPHASGRILPKENWLYAPVLGQKERAPFSLLSLPCVCSLA